MVGEMVTELTETDSEKREGTGEVRVCPLPPGVTAVRLGEMPVGKCCYFQPRQRQRRETTIVTIYVCGNCGGHFEYDPADLTQSQFRCQACAENERQDRLEEDVQLRDYLDYDNWEEDEQCY